MKQNGLTALLLLAVLILAIPVVDGKAMARDFVLIVNRDNPIEKMSSRSIKQIFLYRQTHWPDGAAINIVINDNGPVYEQFSKSMLQKTAGQYLIYRKKLLFEGSAMPPRRVKTDEEVIAFVARHPNGIGFIAATSLDHRVKQLLIEKTSPPP